MSGLRDWVAGVLRKVRDEDLDGAYLRVRAGRTRAQATTFRSQIRVDPDHSVTEIVRELDGVLGQITGESAWIELLEFGGKRPVDTHRVEAARADTDDRADESALRRMTAVFERVLIDANNRVEGMYQLAMDHSRQNLRLQEKWAEERVARAEDNAAAEIALSDTKSDLVQVAEMILQSPVAQLAAARVAMRKQITGESGTPEQRQLADASISSSSSAPVVQPDQVDDLEPDVEDLDAGGIADQAIDLLLLAYHDDPDILTPERVYRLAPMLPRLAAMFPALGGIGTGEEPPPAEG